MGKFPDFDHGYQRGVFEVIRPVELNEFWMLLMIVHSFLNGPDQNGYRHHQLQDPNNDMIANTGPRTNLSFMQYSPSMLQELAEAWIELPKVKDADLQLWDYWIGLCRSCQKPVANKKRRNNQ